MTTDSGNRVKERFWAKVVKTDGCWIWTAGTSAAGYGLFRKDGLHQGAHRVAYELEIGLIPEGMTLDHLCRNVACVRPDHLEPVTMRTNILRGDGITAQKSRLTHCPKGHPYNDANTYTYPDGSRACRACRTEFDRVRRLQRRANYERA